MKYIKILLIYFSMLFVSCSGNSSNELTGKDTSNIITLALSNKLFVKDQKPYANTLYFLKSKQFNTSWPIKSPDFKISYIEDTEDAKTVNVPWKPVDKRTRIGVPKFYLKKDSVYLSLYEFGGRVGYTYVFAKKNDAWTIVKLGSTIE